MIPWHIYRLYRSDTKAKKELTSMSGSIHSRSVWSSGCTKAVREKRDQRVQDSRHDWEENEMRETKYACWREHATESDWTKPAEKRKRDCEKDRESAMLMWKESNVEMYVFMPYRYGCRTMNHCGVPSNTHVH